MIKKVQAVGIAMKSHPYGHANPIHIPSRVAYEIIRAIRGEAKPKNLTSDIMVPGERSTATPRSRA